MPRIAALALLVIALLGAGAASPAVGVDDRVPFGIVDWARADADGTVRVAGWAVDPDTGTSVDIHVYVDGELRSTAKADRSRPDVAAAHGIGERHGFHTELGSFVNGDYEVCVWAINQPSAVSNQRLGCERLRIGPAPTVPEGVVDRLRVVSSRTVQATGWAFDRDWQAPTPLHLYVDGKFSATTHTGTTRPDVAAVHGVGPGQGFDANIDVEFGTHEICVWAINQPSGPNIRLGCAHLNVVDKSAPKGPAGRVVISGTGDVRADPHWYGSPPAYSAAMAGLGGLFHDDDLTVINLECAPSLLGSPIPKNYNFRCDTASLANFASSGVDVANMANNHAQDFGPTAMVDGMFRVTSAGLAEVGAGLDPIDAYQPYLTEINGHRIAVIGMAGFVEFPWNLAAPGRPGLANGYDVAAMSAAVRRADALADIVVVAIHWGNEGVTTQNASQVARGQALVDAGADIVFGHHPHRLQPVEHYHGGVIFYSLGNFVWPRLSIGSADTAVGRVEVTPAGIRACLLDATIVAHGRVSLDNPSRGAC